MRFQRLDDWLAWQETLNPRAIALGLERVAAVWSRLAVGTLSFPVITVAGTNGKGSAVALLEATYQAAGYRTGCYTSPHLLRYNERIHVDGAAVGDDALCQAFARVDAARGETALTYFEFGTLAALDIFTRAGLDLAILEVGLGGRLDAVNLIDADVALVTTIARDHTDWLGDSLEDIAREKAGIFRPGRPAVVGHRDPAASLLGHAASLGCALHRLGVDFDWAPSEGGWTWRTAGPTGEITWGALPLPAMRGGFQLDNATAVLMAVACLASRLPVSAAAVRRGLARARLPGRFQVIPGPVTWILDVAHNAQAAAALAENLKAYACRGAVHAVLAVLRDKDPLAIATPLAGAVTRWHLGQTDGPRALSSQDLLAALAPLGLPGPPKAYSDTREALAGAAALAQPGDCVLVFGSFTTVAAGLSAHGGGDLLL